MATNPRIPDRRSVPTLAAQKQKKGGSPLVPLGIIAAAVLLLVIVFFMPRTPKQTMAPTNAEIPSQPTGEQIQISHTRMVPDPTGNQMYLYTTLFNSGSTAINGVRASVTLQAQNNQALAGVTTVAENADGKSLIDNPIPPNASREVRMNVKQVPQEWNHEMPEIRVEEVTAQSAQ